MLDALARVCRSRQLPFRAGSAMTPAMYDVVIIGAGPAGTAAGYRLALAGRKVLMLDRHRFPRKKACAGGITPKAMDLFPYDISHLVLRICRRVKITRPGGRSFTVRDNRPLCYMVQRRDLDLFSLEKSLAAGCQFSFADRILSLDQDSDASAVTLIYRDQEQEKTVTASFVIGADGANSRIRQLMFGIGRPPVRTFKYPALEADVAVRHPREIPMAFDFSKGIPGYYWIFPRHDHVNIGIYSTAPDCRPDRSLLKAYAAERLGHDHLTAVKGYPIGVSPPGSLSRFAGKGRVLLAGDAAGLAEPLLGEGIYGALKSGQLAAESLDRALGTGNSGALTAYRDALARLRLDLWLHHMAAGLLYRFPGICLGLGRHPGIFGPFARGYAAGRTLSQIILPF